MKTRLLLTGLFVLGSSSLSAQRTDGGNIDRNDCRLAAQIVRTGHPAPHREWAFELISRCPGEGPAALVNAWEAPPTDEATLQLLVRATSDLRTHAIFEGVAGAARNPQNSPLVRAYAMSVLHSYAHPGRSLSVQDLLHPRGNRPPRIYTVSGDGDRTNGELGDVRAEVHGLLSEIVAAEQDPTVLRIARAVLQRV